ncbi:trans-sulfuration enzyme family protein [Spirosoma sp. KUDC1026]|uniref:trans-sulfuration enzyme family protein n=1 Tax=Spirosoma sp. KUDC1026 TaxID=2745947 RepID=UPI00159BA828|nr:PLP-dependent transferase [Spirosoma sp. KUDC1026]QKZ13698.1 aminotransferase class I/II-fold pyridoxal phosphate-dependent enzyme [Spirosoma sp. KUDC1026]
MKKQTKAIRIQTKKSSNREHSVPLYLTSSFAFESAEQGKALFEETEEGNIYSRFSNPNVTEFVEKVCMLENAEDGIATGTGMAAVFASMAGLLKSGDHIVACRALFGSAHQIITQILSKWGITHTYVDATATEAEWEEAIKANPTTGTPAARMVYLETPSNPGLELVDLTMLARLKAKYHFILNVDNCFATPILQTPIDLGADLSIHSATKFMDGQGRVLGGIVVGSKELIQPIRFFARHTGPSLSPFNAWVLSKSLETLELRMERHCRNAQQLAEALEALPDVDRVLYPFLPSHPQYELAKQQMSAGGAIVTIELAGGFERVNAFFDALQIPTLSSNLGDSRTIVTNPNTTTHAKLKPEEKAALGITPGLIRISVGLESIDDLIEDFTQAIEKSADVVAADVVAADVVTADVVKENVA